MTNHFKKDETREITLALTAFLADTAVVYYKTHAFHWNVEGANFYGLHLMFEKFYTKLWKSMDEVAERIRVFGEKAPSNYAELLKNATILEHETSPSAHVMAQALRNDYIDLAKIAIDVATIAQSRGDQITADMMTRKATFLEKAAWMLHSTITGD